LAPITDDPPLEITASLGVSSVQSNSLSPGEWLAESDAALYKAKRSGWNRTCIAWLQPARVLEVWAPMGSGRRERIA
jgi:hypothetical protein